MREVKLVQQMQVRSCGVCAESRPWGTVAVAVSDVARQVAQLRCEHCETVTPHEYCGFQDVRVFEEFPVQYGDDHELARVVSVRFELVGRSVGAPVIATPLPHLPRFGTVNGTQL